MSRRAGQDGHIEQSGKWYVVRWWMDVPGKEERTHKRAKICPIAGPGSMGESERRRRAREIIAESGADDAERFNRVVKQDTVTTFKEQSEQCIKFLRIRKRKPVSSGTIADMERVLRLWLNPYLGGVPLSEVNNGALKTMVDILVDADLSPKTINTYTGIVKTVVASAVNDEGEEIHPRKWNHYFVDMPIVKKKEQNTPTFSSVIMTGLAAWKKLRERVLFILCAATGLRIGEALGIEIDKHISPDFSTIYVRQKVRHGRVEKRLKTDNAHRDVDLHPLATRVLKDLVGKRTKGFLFCTRNGNPITATNVIRRHLHPALKQLEYINPHTGTHKAGNHAFRRFRNTYLRNHTGCPDGLCKYWLGHADQDMSDLYDKIKEDVAFRKKWAEQCGLGFELPSVVPNVPKSQKKTKAQQSE